MILNAAVGRPLTSHPNKARTHHAQFLPDHTPGIVGVGLKGGVHGIPALPGATLQGSTKYFSRSMAPFFGHHFHYLYREQMLMLGISFPFLVSCSPSFCLPLVFTSPRFPRFLFRILVDLFPASSFFSLTSIFRLVCTFRVQNKFAISLLFFSSLVCTFTLSLFALFSSVLIFSMSQVSFS